MESESSVGNRVVRLDLTDGNRRVVRLWECKRTCILETTFGAHGEIIAQRALPGPDEKAEEYFNDAVRETGVEPKAVAFRPVMLEKSCPKCSKDALVRKTEAFSGEVPVMPLYYCKECKGESFYLTDEYLSYLVENNTELFEEAEREQMKADKAAFTAELKRHIISIFASKKIAVIK